MVLSCLKVHLKVNGPESHSRRVSLTFLWLLFAQNGASPSVYVSELECWLEKHRVTLILSLGVEQTGFPSHMCEEETEVTCRHFSVCYLVGSSVWLD